MTRKKILWLSTILVVATGAGVFLYLKLTKTESRMEKVTVDRGKIEVRVQATGIVQAQNRLSMKPPVAGRIEELSVVEGTEVKRGRILGWVSSTERVALLDAARARGKDELKKWMELYRPTPLIAPMTGIVISRAVEPGQTVTVNDAVIILSDKLVVRTDVDETDIGRLKLKIPARLTLDAYPDKPINGEILQIAFDSKTVNNVTVYEVRVQPETIPEFMRSGMTANVSFLIDRKEDVLWVPSEAIHSGENGKYVLTEGAEKPVRTPIEVGITDGKRTEIVKGLAEDTVVLVAKSSMPARAKNASNPFMPFPSGGRGGGGGRRP